MKVIFEILDLLFCISTIYVLYIISYVLIVFYQLVKLEKEDVKINLTNNEKIILLISLGFLLNKII